MDSLPDYSVDLIMTSPPYPMIEMWDEIFICQNPTIKDSLNNKNGIQAFSSMHEILDKIWNECYRVLKNGGFLCINIGDATRTINDDFQLFSNHSRILNYLLKKGLNVLPDILWRKQTNAPNKFMGSGMLPAGAYVTLEHEYILIFRKDSKREFKKEEYKRKRRESAIFWEERNVWFSDVWMDIKGTQQEITNNNSRLRSAAYPFEVAYRIINMFSVKGDLVLDPFLGTGTTFAASMASCRNSIGFEIDSNFRDIILDINRHIVNFSNSYILNRIKKHIDFAEYWINNKGPFKYENIYYGFPVMTRQEKELIFNELKEVKRVDKDVFEVTYLEKPEKKSFGVWISELGKENSDMFKINNSYLRLNRKRLKQKNLKASQQILFSD